MAAAASSSAINDSISDILGEGWQDIVDCPVCLALLVKPKFLSCGHCVCEECERKMVDDVARDRHGITCPKCRKRTFVPAGGLAVNYVLQEVIGFAQEQKKKAMEGPDKMPYVCVPCGKKTGAGEMWLCKDCNSMFVCSTCACKEHRAHELLHVDEIIDQRKKQVTAWKEQVRGRVDELVAGRNTAVTNARDAEHKLAYFTEYLNGPFSRWLNTKRNSLAADVDAFNTSFTSVEDELVGGDEQVGIEELQPKLEAKEAAMNTLVERHRSVNDTSRRLTDMIVTFKTGIRRMDAPPFNEGQRKRSHTMRRSTVRVRSPVLVVDGSDDTDHSPIRLPDHHNEDMASLDIESSSEEPMDDDHGDTLAAHRRPITVFSTDSDSSDNSTRATNGSCVRGSTGSRVVTRLTGSAMKTAHAAAAKSRPFASSSVNSHSQPTLRHHRSSVAASASTNRPSTSGTNMRRITEEAGSSSTARRFYGASVYPQADAESDSDSDLN